MSRYTGTDVKKIEGQRRAGKMQHQAQTALIWLSRNAGRLVHVASNPTEAEAFKTRLKAIGGDLTRVDVKLPGAK